MNIIRNYVVKGSFLTSLPSKNASFILHKNLCLKSYGQVRFISQQPDLSKQFSGYRKQRKQRQVEEVDNEEDVDDEEERGEGEIGFLEGSPVSSDDVLLSETDFLLPEEILNNERPFDSAEEALQQKKECTICKENEDITALNVPHLLEYLSHTGKIYPRRLTGICSKHQRKLSHAVKKARHMGFFTYKKSSFAVKNPMDEDLLDEQDLLGDEKMELEIDSRRFPDDVEPSWIYSAMNPTSVFDNLRDEITARVLASKRDGRSADPAALEIQSKELEREEKIHGQRIAMLKELDENDLIDLTNLTRVELDAKLEATEKAEKEIIQDVTDAVNKQLEKINRPPLSLEQAVEEQLASFKDYLWMIRDQIDGRLPDADEEPREFADEDIADEDEEYELIDDDADEADAAPSSNDTNNGSLFFDENQLSTRSRERNPAIQYDIEDDGGRPTLDNYLVALALQEEGKLPKTTSDSRRRPAREEREEEEYEDDENADEQTSKVMTPAEMRQTAMQSFEEAAIYLPADVVAAARPRVRQMIDEVFADVVNRPNFLGEEEENSKK